MSTHNSVDPVHLMDAADFASPAELFVCRGAGIKRGSLGYHRFGTAAEAIDFAVEHFSALRPDELVMAVEDKRFNLASVRALSRDTRLKSPALALAET